MVGDILFIRKNFLAAVELRSSNNVPKAHLPPRGSFTD